MHFATLLFPIAFALAASADPVGTPSVPQGYTPARQFRHSLAQRDDPEIDPEMLCGANYNDCGDGWCCSAKQNCAGEIETIPVCKDPTVTYGVLQGTEPAMPYDNLDAKAESLSKLLESMTGGPAAGATNTAGSQATGAASVNGLDGFGSMAALVAGLWGVAAVGGAGFFLM